MPHLSADGRILFYDLYKGMNLAGSYALDVLAAANDPVASPVGLAATNPQPQPVPFGQTLSLNPAPAVESTPTPQELPVSSQKDQIAFVRSEDTHSALFVMNSDGSGQRRLTGSDFGSIFNPKWSPDGTQVLFEGWTGSESGLFLAGLDGSLTKLAADSWNAAWSPDGSQIALTTNEEVRVVGRDGSVVTSAPLSKFVGEQDYWTTWNLRWTADGGAVQIMRTQNCGAYPLCKSDRWWVYEMDAKTGAVFALVTSELPIVTWRGDMVIVRDEKSWQWKQNGKVVSTNTPADCATLESGPTQIGATWSPDGKWVLLAVDCYGSGSPDLYLARADGSTLQQVAKNLHMDWYTPVGWSPDGRFITFSADTDAPGNYDIYTLDLTTPVSSPVRLTNSGFNESAPVWQP
jgi:dipeptidyl aminopeptidase/acylaminoacyl peptidase